MTLAATGSDVDLLSRILTAKREEVRRQQHAIPLEELEREARRQERRPFAPALVRAGRAVIAEMKKASPSRGVMRESYSPADIARVYEAAGARALSVLTDEKHFAGSLDHLRQARTASRLPVLRKDFIIDEYQVVESAAAGADAILLIVAALDDATLQRLLQRTLALGMDALVEVHTEEEAARAAALRARLIGVNNRNLSTLSVDITTSVKLRAQLPAGAILVSESGLRSRADLDRLEAAGYRAFLIGEQFMTSADPGSALRELL